MYKKYNFEFFRYKKLKKNIILYLASACDIIQMAGRLQTEEWGNVGAMHGGSDDWPSSWVGGHGEQCEHDRRVVTALHKQIYDGEIFDDFGLKRGENK